ncbi:hypothetical protein EST38_g12350 [Candolleomyces aberdarensis]|uniref:F-box domain-containing protein n=1 Tax=Candolleomyces aberdarensis TaxID=2316362 RepID=A0A4Q2D437_9AGAR|nr:hypothetical protein EST38_g12350 [Candolleomyces aberdarensis]
MASLISGKNERLFVEEISGCSRSSVEYSESPERTCDESSGQAAVDTAENHDILSHIPDELLTLIFLFSLPDGGRPPAMVSSDSPISLTHVCKRWRSLAHSIPELWTSVHLLLAYFRPGAFDEFSESEFEDENERISAEERIQAEEDNARLPFIRSWFSHTRPADSLQLSVSDELIFSNFSSPITDFILTLLDRVESLDLMLCRRTLPRFTEFRPRAYERLRKLRLAGDGFDPDDWCFLLYDAPDLAEFDIRALRAPVTSLPLNWSRLTRLAVSYFNDLQDVPSIGMLKAVLKDTPGLRSLRMVVRGDVVEGGGVRPLQEEDEEEQERIILPDLLTLELEFSYCINTLFDTLSLPSLTHVQLVEDRSQRYPPVPPTPSKVLLHLLSSHREPGLPLQKIRKIEIEAVYYQPSTLIECLEMVPGLRHLSLLAPLSNCDRRVFDFSYNHQNDGKDRHHGTFGFGDEVLEALTTSVAGGEDIATPVGILCPDLEYLEVLDSRCDWLFHRNRSPEAMVRFLRSRVSSPGGLSKLKRIVLPKAWAPSKEEAGFAEFCSLRESLDIRMVGSPGDEDNDEGRRGGSERMVEGGIVVRRMVPGLITQAARLSRGAALVVTSHRQQSTVRETVGPSSSVKPPDIYKMK